MKYIFSNIIFDPTVYIGDCISAFSTILLIVGGIFTYVQWKKSLKLKNAEYINELSERLATDTEIQEAFYMLDYSDLWYSKDFHGSGILEQKIDKTLSFFSYICYLKKARLITQKEFKFFEYRISRTLLNNQIQDYFYNLYHFSKRQGVPFTFDFLYKYGVSKKLFDKEFYNNRAYLNTNKYHHYINF